MLSKRLSKRDEGHGILSSFLLGLDRGREYLKQEEKKKVAYHDAFDASSLNELKYKIVEREIK
jgi:hypothetical protein